MNEQERKEAKAELEQLKEKRLERAFVIDAHVFRDSVIGDCTNGGESARFNRLYVFAERMSVNAALLYIEEEGLNPEQCVKVENRKPCGEDYLDAFPLADGRRDKWHMDGGNFLYSCDSRFQEVTGSVYPVPIHDRIETYEQSCFLSCD